MDSGFLAFKTAKVQLLRTWMESIECQISPKIFYPFEFDGVFGMVACQPLEPGEVLVKVNASAVLSTECLLESPLQKVFLEHPWFFGRENPEGLDNQYLALVIHEKSKGRKSIWKYFFEVLPERLENLCDWTSEELEELQDVDLMTDIQIRKEKYFSSYRVLQGILNSFQEFFPEFVSLEQVEWAWKIIWTRCFMRSAQHSALIPFADFFNHGESSTCFYFEDQNDSWGESFDDVDEILTDEEVQVLSFKDLLEISFSAFDLNCSGLLETSESLLVEAEALQKMLDDKKKVKENEDNVKNSDFIVAVGKKQTYSEGDQVFLEYGNYSNTALLMHYGFSILNNRHEFFRLKVKLEDFLSPGQKEFLPRRFNLNSVVIFHLNSKELNRELLRCLRALSWKPENKKTSFFSQSDVFREIQVISQYLEIVKNRLSLFPTSILQDRCSKTNSSRLKFAVSLI
jgi:hypothetical protein